MWFELNTSELMPPFRQTAGDAAAGQGCGEGSQEEVGGGAEEYEGQRAVPGCLPGVVVVGWAVE